MTAGGGRAPCRWTGRLRSPSSRRPPRVARGVGAQPDVAAAVPAATAPFAAAGHHAPVGRHPHRARAPSWRSPPGYTRAFPTVRLLHGTLRPGAVVLDQQLAATLQARVGDTRLARRPAGGAARALPGQRGRARPVPGRAVPAARTRCSGRRRRSRRPTSRSCRWPRSRARFAPASARDPAARAGRARVPGAQTGVQWQVQAQLDPAALQRRPRATRSARATSIRDRLERTPPGQVRFVDNLSTRSPAPPATRSTRETLFIMLAVPGPRRARRGLPGRPRHGRARPPRSGAAARPRRPPARPARPGPGREPRAGRGRRALGAAAAFAAVSPGSCGGGGVGSRRCVVTLALHRARHRRAPRRPASARAWPCCAAARRGSPQRPPERSRCGSGCGSTWAALAVSGLVYWLTARTGFSAVVNPDSNPTLSLSVYMFLAPALLWVGAAAAARPPARADRRVARRPGRRQARRRRARAPAGQRLPARHRHQPRPRAGRPAARLRRRARAVRGHVRPAVGGGRASHAGRRRRGHGAAGRDRRRTVWTRGSPPSRASAATSAVDHSYAYVGPDLQDTFGIDASTLPRATTLRDSYFLGGTRHADAGPAAQHARRDPRLEGDDHRLPATRGRPPAAAGARPAHRPLPPRPFHVAAWCRSSRPRRATRSWSRTSPISSRDP